MLCAYVVPGQNKMNSDELLHTWSSFMVAFRVSSTHPWDGTHDTTLLHTITQSIYNSAQMIDNTNAHE